MTKLYYQENEEIRQIVETLDYVCSKSKLTLNQKFYIVSSFKVINMVFELF